jgi:dihydroorotase
VTDVPDFLLRGGAILDGSGAPPYRGDLLVRDGRIAALGEVGKVSEVPGVEVVDVAGAFVAPGFIDIHAHVFHREGVESTRLPADRVGVQQGVACLVDAGSSGAATLDEFPGAVHATQRTPVFALVNIGSPGLQGKGEGHSSRPGLVSLEATVRAVERHRAWVRGIKVQASHSHTGTYGLTAVALARKAADLTGLPLMMHIGNAPPVLDEVLPYLHEGDLVTHAYHGKVGGALTHGDVPLPALVEAIERGVVIDIGHGRSSFAFAMAERALAAGLPIHTISTDIHARNVDRYVVSLARTMSKVLLLGLPLEEVVRAVTATPARALRLDADGFGSIALGRPAHLTVFRMRDETIALEDAEGEVREAPRWVEPLAVYVDGERFEVTAPV